MLYVDQPIGTGFSYGTDPVTSTVTAAPYVWKLLQAFFAQFPQYESRDFGIFTESYGGHYGPGTSPQNTEQLLQSYIFQQNLHPTSSLKIQLLQQEP
jgi:carboxypeptidase C (cathepsin A)